jgi:hypothetical protein
MGLGVADLKGSWTRGVQEEEGRQNRTLRLHVVTPGYWPAGLPEQSNVMSSGLLHTCP